MSQPSRRGLLGALATLAGVAVAGCLGGNDLKPATERPSTVETDRQTETERSTERTDDPPETISSDCAAAEVPRPTDAATAPREYPEAPAELSTSSVSGFVETYEEAYQYNRRLADDPRKIGRLNGLSVYVAESQVTVESDADPRLLAVVVSGQVSTSITADGGSGTTTPETPTVTPLPTGHWPFETSYLVSDRGLRREGLVVECF